MNTRKAGYLGGGVGLAVGFFLGLFWNRFVEELTGNVIREGFGTDARNALGKAFLGAVIGLIGGKLLLEHLTRQKNSKEDKEDANVS